jgi:hypothetical protein
MGEAIANGWAAGKTVTQISLQNRLAVIGIANP